MSTSKKIDEFLSDAKRSDVYWVEKAKLDFAIKLDKQRKQSSLNLASVARKIGKSPAYITKVFRGDSNLTIESMVKLARAIGGNLRIQIVDEAPVAHRWDKVIGTSTNANQSRATASAATVIQLFPTPSQGGAANHLQKAA
jgi:transcriptional regulator with XRE-family HTH domain